jgi:alcohol dehydrogenase, propanol-preferring
VPGWRRGQLHDGKDLWVGLTCLGQAPGLTRICRFYYPGTFQQYAIAPAHYATPIPEGVPSDLAAPLLCGGVTVYTALKKLIEQGARAGDWVAVPGAGGGLGHLALQYGKAMGFRMVGVDMGEKEKMVKDCGGEVFFDLSKYGRDEEGTKKLVEEVKAATGGGVKGAVVCTANNTAYAQALSFLKFRGTLVCVGVPEGKAVPIATADPATMLVSELKIVGSAVGNRKDAIEALEFAARYVDCSAMSSSNC